MWKEVMLCGSGGASPLLSSLGDKVSLWPHVGPGAQTWQALGVFLDSQGSS